MNAFDIRQKFGRGVSIASVTFFTMVCIASQTSYPPDCAIETSDKFGARGYEVSCSMLTYNHVRLRALKGYNTRLQLKREFAVHIDLVDGPLVPQPCKAVRKVMLTVRYNRPWMVFTAAL